MEIVKLFNEEFAFIPVIPISFKSDFENSLFDESYNFV